MRISVFMLLCLSVVSVAANPPSGADADGRLKLPSINQLERISSGKRPSREASRDTAFIIKTKKHKVNGDTYVILTDHTDQEFIQSLERLAEFRKGKIIRTDDLAKLHENKQEFRRIQDALRKIRVNNIAIAPRSENYRENMVLGMWELLTTLDKDPQLDAYPGFLLASDAKALARLVDRSMVYKPKPNKKLRPLLISQVPSRGELRSLQKSGILQKMFKEDGYEVPVLAIYSAKAKGALELAGESSWQINNEGRGAVKKLPSKAKKAFDEASLLVMHGHGTYGMSCGLDIAALPDSLDSLVMLCGSCFSAAPKNSDFPKMRQAPGGYSMEPRDAFALRAAEHGAVAVFGHMRLNAGFPYLFPVLETWMEGRTVGEAYQELMNAIIEKTQTDSGDFIVNLPLKDPQGIPQNKLLYVIIGDPALQPLSEMK